MNSNIFESKIIKKWRYISLLLLIFISLLAVLIKLFMIQIVKREDYREAAEHQHISEKPLYAKRGDILDKNGKLIAASHTFYTIAADPAFIQNIDIVATEMAHITGKTKAFFIKKLKRKGTNYVKLASGIYGDEIDTLKKINDRGMILIPEHKRLFLYGSSLAQIIGLDETQTRLGSGIEGKWDEYLRGEDGFITLNRDGRRQLRPAADLPVKPPKHGDIVQLTIDIELQNILEYELKNQVLKSQAKSGTAVIMEPSTGKVLAMASYPNFNPNTGEGNIPDNRRIRAITDTYEPGSTFKMIIAAIAMDMGIVNEDSKYYGYKGYYAGYKFVIRDTHPVDTATFKEAVIHSSNIIFAQVANKIPDNVLYKYIRDFGFSIPLGIELSGETTGRVPKPKEFNGNSKKYIGHGYELSATPLQLTSAYSAIANGGNLMKPYIIERIQDTEGNTVLEFKPEFIRKVIADTTAKRIAELFTAVVDSGTGTNARINDLRIVGKTGTAQQVVNGKYSKEHYTASFAGFFPADDPKLAISIVIDRPKGNYYGGSNAAPVFRNIAARIVSNTEYSIAVDDNSKNDSVIVPDLFGLHTSEAQLLAKELDLDIDYDDEGYIIGQSPPAGIFTKKNDDIYLNVLNKSNLDSLPDLTGMPLKTAVKILIDSNIEVKIKGAGKVVSQKWSKNKDGRNVCNISAK
jgi:cell division protein FtsI (penicillin-binding protein 3)